MEGGSHVTASLFSSVTPSGISGAAWAPDGKHVAIAIAGGLVDVAVDDDHSVRLASTKDELHACDWSSNAKWIACASGNWTFGGPGGIYGNLAPSSIVLVPQGGGEPREITDRTTTNASPIWSHNGRILYFLSNRQGTSDVYAVKITEDGRVEDNPVRITTGLEASSIALSRDGKHLLYAASFSRANIWSVPIPSGGSVDADSARPVTSGTQIIEAMSVSRDRKWLLYDSNLHGRSDIYRVPTAGGPTERLTTDATGNFMPSLSLDGQWLSYHSWRTGSRDIFVQRLADGRVEQVTATPSQECCPHLSPDGRTILFLDQFVENGVTRGTYLVRRNESGRWSTPISLPRGVAGNGSWSPDGRLYAYSRLEFAPPTKGTIEVLSFDSGAQRAIYEPHSPDDPVAESVLFSENGKTLYFKSHNQKGHAFIWSIPTSGGRPSVLVRFEDLARPSSRREFAAGAGHFYFTLQDRQSDIWMADVIER
jgi:Tol biopolymer transport system component